MRFSTDSTTDGISAAAVTWWAITVGWLLIALFVTAGVLGGNSGTPPFPTVNAGIALAAFWFVASLALSALAGLFELLNTFGGSPIFGKWWLPIAALAVGLFIARIGWSYQAVAP